MELTGYLIGLNINSHSPPLIAWIDKKDNEVDELIYSYFANLAKQHIRYKSFIDGVTQDAMETVSKISSSDGRLPINAATVYATYEHPDTLIYNSDRQEIKRRVSLTKLLNLFPNYLVQINKSCLVNPEYIIEDSLDHNNDRIRVKVGSSITRLKVGKTFLPKLQKTLEENQ